MQWKKVLITGCLIGLAGAGVLPCVCKAETVPPTVSALSAVVYAPDSDLFLYEKDSTTVRPMASTTKLMTALVAAEQLDVHATVKVPAAALPVEGTQVGLCSEDTVTVTDLLASLLLASGNDAANALALLSAPSMEDFASLMNAKATALGLGNSHFVTPSGLDRPGHGSCARDMARLGATVLQNPVLASLCASARATVTLGGRKITLKNHNRLLEEYSGCIGMKTGFTKKAGRCLVTAACRDGVTLIAVTLNDGNDWKDHTALLDYGFSLVEKKEVPFPSPDTCRVTGAGVPSLPFECSSPLFVTAYKGVPLDIRTELPRFLFAPVEAGKTIGKITVFQQGKCLGVFSLTARESVAAAPPLPFFKRIKNALRYLFFKQ